MDLEQTIWTQERLERMVHDQASEHLNLEYKAAQAAEKHDTISKAVSGMANADGGIIVFGMKENADRPKRAVSLDPIDPSKVSKERLDDLITSNIRPKIQGLRVHVVSVTGGLVGNCYVVEVPRSDTVHQASDNKYYRRRNFKVEPMEDYEVREGIMRSQHPIVKSRIRMKGDSILVEIENVGNRLAKHFAVRIESPTKLGDSSRALAPFPHDCTKLDNSIWQLTFPISGQCLPLFPGELRVYNYHLITLSDQLQIPGTIRCTLFADEMPFREKSFPSTDFGSNWIEW